MADPTDPAGTDEPAAGRHYPADHAQLRAWFSIDEACLDFVDWLRWPNGFICSHPDCQTTSAEDDVLLAGTGAIGDAGGSQ